MSNGKIIFHLESTLERLCYLLQVKDLMQIIVKFRAEKIVCTFLSFTKKYAARKQFVAIL